MVRNMMKQRKPRCNLTAQSLKITKLNIIRKNALFILLEVKKTKKVGEAKYHLRARNSGESEEERWV